MTEIVFYVAASLDGYIATPDGGVEWLSMVDSAEEDYGYAEFYTAVEALLMGSRTYEQVLGFGTWPYAGKPCWVFTQRRLPLACSNVVCTSESPSAVVAALQAANLRRVWLLGRAQLAASFRAHGLISEYILSVIPVILGAGIPLYMTPGPTENLQLVDTKSYPSGVVQLRYRCTSYDA